MSDLDDTERRKYEGIWTHADYRRVSPGAKSVAFAVTTMAWEPPAYIADLGCGTGKASIALADLGFSVNAVDIAANALDPAAVNHAGVMFFNLSLTDERLASLRGADGFCTDVMEHIPPDQVDQVLENIAKTFPHVFFGIAHFHDTWHGETLHLTVEPVAWWGDKLRQHFHHVEHLSGFNIRSDKMNSFWRCENGTA